MHFTCGVTAGAMFQFYGKMFVYCKKDRLKQRLDHLPVPPDRDCVICYETVEPDLKVEIVLCSAPSVPQPVFTITEKAPTRSSQFHVYIPWGQRPFNIVSL